MIRSSRVHIGTLGMACLAVMFTLPSASLAQGTTAPGAGVRQPVREVASSAVAQQLGLRLAPGLPEELGVGTSLTGTLVDSTRLAPFGIRDARAGARVSVARLGPERVRVEIDEIEPVVRSRGLTLRLGSDGRLIPPAP